MKHIFSKPIFKSDNRYNTDMLTNYAKHCIEEIMDSYKNEIIEIAGKHLADKLLRTKSAKMLLEGIEKNNG